MRSPVFILLFFLSLTATAQRVGVVLSGGAAKGLAHVGVLKALEENEIPVDYIVGTSIGGIIGGCYASGMSPEEIEAMVLSPAFSRWINGLPETGFNYYYHRADETPQFVKLNLALDSTWNFQFNSALASDVSLNFAIADPWSARPAHPRAPCSGAWAWQAGSCLGWRIPWLGHNIRCHRLWKSAPETKGR